MALQRTSSLLGTIRAGAGSYSVQTLEHPMPRHEYKTISGTITHVFGHRFVLRTGHGDVVADLSPNGAEQIALRLNDEVTIEGEMKPSELKVVRLTRAGDTIRIEHKPKPPKEHGSHVDPSVVLAAAEAAGFAILGLPRRKPKHFELLGRHNGEFSELHIELDGHIRKTKPIGRDDQKWSDELRSGV